MSDPRGAARPTPNVLLKGMFSPQLRIYLFVYWTLVVVCSIVGIVLLPFWLVLGTVWIRRYHASLRCDLTDRSVVVAKGVFFRRELTIPLDKIQDISIREGPLLKLFGLLRLRIETAGQSNANTGTSDADLVGLLNAREVRDTILERRDALVSVEMPAAAQDPNHQLLVEIRDALLRLETRTAAAGPAPQDR